MAPQAPGDAPLAALPSFLAGDPEDVRRAFLEAAGRAVEAVAQGGPCWTAEALAVVSEGVRVALAAAVAEDGAEGFARFLEPRGPRGLEMAERTRNDGPELTVAAALKRLAYVLAWEVEPAGDGPTAAGALSAQRPGTVVPVARAALALTGPIKPGMTWSEHGSTWTEPAPSPDLGGLSIRFDTRYLPAVVAARLVAGDYRDLRSRDVIPLLDLVFDRLSAAFALEPYNGRRVPKLELPTGRALATTLGRPSKGPTGTEADATLWALSGLTLTDPRGTIQRLFLSLERRRHGGGRSSAWLVTPGELLLPTLPAEMAHLARRGKLSNGDRPWRRVFPWPDRLAPDDWTASTRHRTQAAYLGLALALAWTEGAGREHGKPWLHCPGVLLNDRGWGDLVDRAHADALRACRGRALDAWAEAGWISVEGDLVAPGSALPRLAAALAEAAGLARKNARPRRTKSMGRGGK